MWLITTISLIGVILNIKKKKICFVIWFFTNATWCIYDFYIGAYAQSFLFLIYTGLAIWGMIEWRKK
jgi:nicotinamide riboside transporter PnuC